MQNSKQVQVNQTADKPSHLALKTTQSILGRYGIYVAFLILVIVMSFATPIFLTADNFINIIRQVSVKGILAIGMTFVLLTGGIDLGVGSVLGLTGVIATSLATTEHNLPLAVSLLVGVGVGVACGSCNGFLVAKAELPSFIVTLAMTTVARGLALMYTNGRPVINLTGAYKVIGNQSIGPIPISIIIFIVVILIAAFLLEFTTYGRHIRSVGGNELAAKTSGISTRLIKFSAYAIMGACSAVAGIILTSRVQTGNPSAGSGYELDAIAAAVIGGTSLSGGVGSVVGTVIGILLIGVLSNGLDLLNVSSYLQDVIKGVIIVAAVLLDRKKLSLK